MTGDVLYHVDGELVPAEDATIRVDDRGFRFGDAAFETLRAYGGGIFEWEAHADRLDRTCEALGMRHGLERGDLGDRIAETLAANDFDDAYVRLSLTRGVQPGKLTPHSTVDPTVVVIVAPLPRGGVEGVPVWDGPASVRTVETRRIPDAAIPAHAKTHNYLNGILARIELRDGEAESSGEGSENDSVPPADSTPSTTPSPSADEALLLDADGSVAEGATSNVFFVNDGTLHTPSTDGPVLPGITRRVVLDLAAEADVPVEEGRYEPGAIREADEVFLTNTTWEVRPVESVDGSAIGSEPIAESGTESEEEVKDERIAGPITRRLMIAFDRRVEDERYGPDRRA